MEALLTLCTNLAAAGGCRGALQADAVMPSGWSIGESLSERVAGAESVQTPAA